MSLKTENSRRVAKSRPVCMGLKSKRTAGKIAKYCSTSIPHTSVPDNLAHQIFYHACLRFYSYCLEKSSRIFQTGHRGKFTEFEQAA